MCTAITLETIHHDQLNHITGGRIRIGQSNGGRPATHGRVTIDQPSLSRMIPATLIGVATGAAGGPAGMLLGGARGAAVAFAQSLRWHRTA